MTLIFSGLVFLLLGAEILVRGASRLASSFSISPLVIGLTVVAFGTSAPEFAVSVGGALAGQGDLALGNVVGSNIFNVLFILGLAAVIHPLTVAEKLVRLDVPLMIGASLLVLLFGWDSRISRFEGLALLVLGITYTVVQIRQGLVHGEGSNEASLGPANLTLRVGRGRALLMIALGLGFLVFGARWLVEGATGVARSLGIGELVIGLTVVAAGTSLPEVATSVLASLRGERDIAVGNVIGSNLFNILWVLGLTSALSPQGVAVSASSWGWELPMMMVSALVCLPILFSDFVVSRWEGGLFLATFLAYTAFLVANALGVAIPWGLRFGLLGLLVLGGMAPLIFLRRKRA